MLYYTNGVTGNRIWFVSLPNKILAIEFTFDREAWRKEEIFGDEVPQKYIDGYEAESISDYRNLIKLIFSKELMK